MLLGLMGLLAAPPVSAALSMRRALVIAHNGSDDPALAPLRFADDDGVMWAETLQRLGVETTLLVEPDDDTRQSGRPVLAGAREPTPEEVGREVARLRAAHRADRASGRESDVLIVYVGHGNTDEAGRAFFTLKNGRLDQTALYTQVVDALQATYVHVIVDACRASGVVGRRGQTDAAVVKEMRDMLAREQLASRPHVGVLFAESESGETHEWSYIRAGVFSHVARSGLMGGADINSDREVEYSELGAFVTASLQGVKQMPARLSVYTSPPARAPRRPLVGTIPHGPSLTLPADFKHTRIFVEDAEGRRLADVRRLNGQRLELHLPERDVYWVRTPTEDEVRLELSQLSEGVPQLMPPEMRRRGPIEEALRRGLFAVPLDRAFYEQYVSTAGLTPVLFPPPSRVHVPPEPIARASEPVAPPPEPIARISVPIDLPPVPATRASEPSESPFKPRARYIERVAWTPESSMEWKRRAQGPEESGWELGLGMFRLPLGEGVLATGLSTAWRYSPEPPAYVGVRAAYALTPFAAEDSSRMQRGTLQALLGVQVGMGGRLVGFLEAATGIGLMSKDYPGDRLSNPLIFANHLAAGVGMHVPLGQLRLNSLVGPDLINTHKGSQWGLTYGVELTLRFWQSTSQ